jgi:hypothetical protein
MGNWKSLLKIAAVVVGVMYAAPRVPVIRDYL